jgi:molybdopterin/thiamine biosynthesis adenylyltransferase
VSDTGIEYTRQQDWFDPRDHPDAHVTIVGVGGIGSPTALALAKLGIPNLTLIDHDYVEPHNVPSQMYGLEDVGRYKVDALQERIGQLTDARNVPYAVEDTLENYEGAFQDVIVSALDSMAARTSLWGLVKHKPYVPLLLDARLGGQSIVLYAVNPCDPEQIEFYESRLYSDEQARDYPCTAAAVIDVGFQVASLITRAVRLHYAGEPVERSLMFDQRRLIVMKEDI